MPHGDGVFIDQHGTEFRGDFYNGQMRGQVIIITPEGMRWEGDVGQDGKMDGRYYLEENKILSKGPYNRSSLEEAWELALGRGEATSPLQELLAQAESIETRAGAGAVKELKTSLEELEIRARTLEGEDRKLVEQTSFLPLVGAKAGIALVRERGEEKEALIAASEIFEEIFPDLPATVRDKSAYTWAYALLGVARLNIEEVRESGDEEIWRESIKLLKKAVDVTKRAKSTEAKELREEIEALLVSFEP